MEDPDSASPPPAMEDPASLQAEVMADPDLTSLQAAMEDPITASIGPVGPLLRKLHSIGPEDEMRPLMVFCISLKNLSEDEDASSTNRRWMKIARELVYDAEDHLDEASGAGAPHDFSELLARVKDASKRRELFQWSPPKTIQPSEPGEAGASRLTPPSFPICAVRRGKGVVELPRKLVDVLALGDVRKTLKVIPINGCGGVGKTTVARALYHNHGGKFQCRAFVTVSRNIDMRAFLTTILSQLKAPRPRGFPDVPNLIDAIRKYLQDKRYLIVVDDLWSASVWDIISSAFPHGDSCSRIITTTQIDDVALACCSYDSDYIYKMEPLNDLESRNLFFSRMFGSEDGCPTDIKDVSYKIIRKCGGLPLAIVNVASILASESDIVREKLKHIQDSLPSEGMKDVLNLIYNSLPAHLRTCLLYLSMYPQGCVIKKDDLVKHWVAEGFISAMGGGDAEEIAGGYFDELLSRGLVQAVDANNNGDVLSCTVHQMVLDFISCKSLEQNFVINVDYLQSTLALPDKVRRLSVQFGGVKSAYIPESIVTSHVRSLIFYGFFKCVPSIKDFGLLRVLILHIWADRNKSFDLTTIGKIYQLKYIKIECNITVKLPGKIRRLQHLGALHVDARLSAVPSDIVNLERLLHLCLPSDSIMPSVVAQITSLRTLGYFDLSSLSEEDALHLGRLTNLQDLQLTCSTVHPAENLEKNVRHLCSILEKLRVLQSLTLVPASNSSSAASTMIPYDSFSMVSPPPDLLLRRIELSQRCCIFFRLPKWFGELRKLCILKIAIRQLWKEDVDILKGILSLTALTLYAQTAPAKKIIIAEGGFQVLTYFKFMCAAPCLFFEQEAMPKVQKLKLGFNSDKMKLYSLGIAGFHYLTGLADICVKFGVQDGEEFDIRVAESALEAAFSNRPNTCIIRVQRMDVILDGEEPKTTVTDKKGDTTSVNRHDIRDQSQGARGDQSQLIQGERDQRGSMEKYEPVRGIGLGNFGVSKMMRNRDTRELVAMKFIERGHRIDENVFWEIVNHRALQHPNIIRFKEVVLTPTHLGIVMEYAAGGELFERICDAGRFHEDEARYFFQQLVCGVSFCHAMQICHRDLKLENILLDGSPAPRLKICDFGYSKSSVLHSRPKSTVGTPTYIAPEVLSRREYDGKLADVWSCGVTLYVMLVGGYPFEDTKDPKNFRKTISRIMSVQYKIPDYVHISQNCRHLLSQIFVADPRNRITMDEIKAHPWFLKNLPRELQEEAQQAYYNRRHAEAAAPVSASAPHSAQSVDEIMRIVQEAQTVPKPIKPMLSGDAYADDNDDSYEEEKDDYGEEGYDRTVREIHASGRGDLDIGEFVN